MGDSRRHFLKILGLGAAAAPIAFETARAAAPSTPAIATPAVGHRDPFYVPPELVPPGMAYNWKRRFLLDQVDRDNIDTMIKAGWRAVPASRHDGVFMPRGWWGNIEVGGLILMEKAA